MNSDEIEELFYGDTYEQVTASQIMDQSRWSTFYEQVFKKKSDGTLWEATWSRGSTEHQDNGVEDVDFYEVVPKEVTITIYERKHPLPERTAVSAAPALPPETPTDKLIDII